MSTDEVMVIVRDIGVSWVGDLAGAAREAGCRVGLVTSPTERSELARLTSVTDRMTVLEDPTDPPAVAAAARRLAGVGTLSAVLSGNDGCVAAAARAGELAGLRHTPSAPIAVSRNKYAARAAMAAAGMAGPGFGLLAGEAQAAEVAARVGVPAVVKPLSGTGSHLVAPVDSAPQLAAAYRWLAERVPAADLGLLYSKPLDCGAAGLLDPTRVFLVESRLRGPELCLDLIVRDGVVEQLALIDKFLIDERFFELGFVSPPLDLSPERERRIRAVVDDAVRSLGLDNTVAHIELIDDETIGPAIVEVNAGRPGGPLSRTLYRLTAGIDTAAEQVAAARREPPPRTSPKLPVPLAAVTVFARGSGRLRAIHGLDTAASHPDVVDVAPVALPGAVLTDEREIHGVCLVVAGFLDSDDLVTTYQELAELVRLELDPVAGSASAG